MGKKSSSKPPAPPNPADTAAAQAKANRIAQFTPQGTLLFGKQVKQPDGSFEFVADPTHDALQLTESPTVEQIRGLGEETALSLAGQAQTAADTLPSDVLTTEGLPDLLTGGAGIDDLSEHALRAGEATFQRGLGFLSPELDRQEENLRQSLANRGLPLGYEEGGEYTGANAELERFDRNRNELFNNLALDSIRAAGAEQSRQFGLQSAARSQGLQERAVVRNQRFNELASLLGLQPVQQANLGQFVPPAAVDIVGPTNLAYQGQLNAFNQAQQNRASTLGGLFDLGGAIGSSLILSSDRRLKRDISLIGSIGALGVYLFRYLWSDHWHVGLMADEVRKVKPHAVIRVNGYDMVNYTEALS